MRLSWTYDRYGNRTNQTVTAGSAPSNSLAISTANNRVTSAGFLYDANGNLTQEGSASLQYKYDAENRMVSFNSGTATYSYAGALRVKKVAGSTTTVYVFSGSKVIAEYLNSALSKEYVYSGGTLLATIAGSAVTYHQPDHLSTRLETDLSGVVTRTFGQFPYGELWYETGTASKWKFTSYERDTESGLDQAVFRYHSSRVGRLASPDPLAGSISEPQSLNLYPYVGNDPVNFADPLGLKRPVDDDGIGGAGGVRIYLALGGGLSGGNYSIDRLDVPDRVGQAFLGTGAVASVQAGTALPGSASAALEYGWACVPTEGVFTSINGQPIGGHVDCEWRSVPVGVAAGDGNSSGWTWNFTKSFFKDFSLKGQNGKELCSVTFAKTVGSDFNPFTLGPGTAAEVGSAAVVQESQTAAVIYAGQRVSAVTGAPGLICPMCSSTVRGILAGGRTAGAAITLGALIFSEVHGLRNEIQAMAAGACDAF